MSATPVDSSTLRPRPGRVLAELFAVFFVVGTVVLGGGYPMVMYMKHLLVDKRRWIDENTFFDMLGISLVTPGPIAINLATFVGYRLRGITGSAVATLAITIPAAGIILLIAWAVQDFEAHPLLRAFLAGVMVAVVAQIGVLAAQMARRERRDVVNLLLAAVSLVLLFTTRISPVWLVLAGGLAGVLAAPWRRRKEGTPS